MGCLYLHIGTPKTGTSTIQFFLAKNRGVLKEKGYCYPVMQRFDKIGVNRNAHFLIYRHFDENQRRDTEVEEEVRDRGLKRLLEKLDAYENVVMSDESLWNGSYHWYGDFWNRLNEDLTSHGHTMKVIVYLRRQDAYVQSYWAQDVKGRSQKRTFAEYIECKPGYNHMNYLETLDWIAEAVGREHIIVRPFERGQFFESSLLADFMQCIGLELTDEYRSADQVMNESVSGEYLQVKQILNANPVFGEKKGFMTKLLYEAERTHERKPDYQRAASFPEGRAAFMEQFEALNAEVARKYLNRKDGTLFYDKVVETEAHAYSTEELVQACGDLIMVLKQELDEMRSEQLSLRVQMKKLWELIYKRFQRIIRSKNIFFQV